MDTLEARSPDLAALNTTEFLTLLTARNIHVDAAGERLRVGAPTGAIDAALKVELTCRKQALLKALKSEHAAASLLPLDAETLRGRLPLTPAQRGMWLIDHFDPGNVAYNIPEAFRLEEAVDLMVFQAAVDQLLARHSLLRISFHEEEGELFQTIDPEARATVGFTNISGLDQAVQEQNLRELIRAEGRRPFDLSLAPLARFHVYQLAPNRHVIFSNVHHIIADRVSLHVLRRELVALSDAIHRRTDANLPALPLQYADYVVWISSDAQRDIIGEQIEYWRRKLAHPGVPVELPHRQPRPEKRHSWGSTQPVTITSAERKALVRIGIEEGASPFMTLLAVFALLIARVAQLGANDFCIGSPITNRKHPATKDMLGLFVNMLVFRCEIRPGQSFREVLRTIRSTALEAYDNSDAPFQSVVKASKHDRRSKRSPIFQIMFGYETYLPQIANELQMDADPGTARYDLSLLLAETESEGLSGCFEYCTDLFAPDEIATLATAFQTLIATVAQNPEYDGVGLESQNVANSK